MPFFDWNFIGVGPRLASSLKRFAAEVLRRQFKELGCC